MFLVSLRSHGMRTSRHPILPPHSVIGGSLNLLLLALLAEKVARRRYMFVLSIVHRLPGLISRRNTIKLTYGVDESEQPSLQLSNNNL